MTRPGRSRPSAPAPVPAAAAERPVRADSEHEQALIRVVLGLAAVVYLLWATGAARLNGTRDITTICMAVAFITISLALLVRVRRATRPSVGRRYFGIVLDSTATSAVLYVNGELAAPLFVVYLWVTFGNGFRYGESYLATSAALSVLGFSIAVTAHGLWRSQPYWTSGILLGLVVLPAYAAALLRKLRAAIRQAEEASTTKSQFVANISHEIRTPLHGIVGLDDLLLGTPLSETQRRYAELISQSATWLLEIVNDVLDFSKIEAGFFELERAPFDLRGALANVIGLHGEPSRLKGVMVAGDIDEAIPGLVMGDELRVTRVFNNLVGNAVKFTPRGRINVRARVERATPTHVAVAFEVADTGIGIPRHALERIFEPFFQADGSPSRRHGGTGLGLAISYRLVDRMGGTLAVDTQQGAGTTFRFTLTFGVADARRTASGPALPHAGTTPSEIVGDAGVAGLRILAVEDNAVNLELLVNYLTRFGCNVVTATTGREAVDARWTSGCQLILMDCQMPEMDGYAATEAIRIAESATAPDRPHVPIIALTAHASPQDRERCLAAGMDDYLAKPFRPAALLELLQHWAAGMTANAVPPTAVVARHVATRPEPAPVPEGVSAPTLRQVFHDLNNQLMIVVGLGELCIESLPEGSGEREELRKVVQAGEAAVQIIRAESQRLGKR